MKYIHFPTLLLHGGLLVFAHAAINHYHDAFLLVSIAALILHAVWSARSKKQMAISHALGCAAQFAVFQFGLIDVNSGAFGLGGGEFALFFYEIALIASLFAAVIIGLFKRTA